MEGKYSASLIPRSHARSPASFDQERCRKYKDLSHWLIPLCVPHTVTRASGNWERLTRPDPIHGIAGLKWDEEVSKLGSKSFFFVLKGQWDVADSAPIAAKAGSEEAVGYLPGPSCDLKVCRVDYDVTTQGSFSEFRDPDPEYLGGWNMQPSILVD
nr:hypothetical protein [Bacillota bacterium]